jgi:hypothetical protein
VQKNRRRPDDRGMNTHDNPASLADIQAVSDAAEKRRAQVLLDSVALEAAAQHLRDGFSPGRIGFASLMERCAKHMRQLVE